MKSTYTIRKKIGKIPCIISPSEHNVSFCSLPSGNFFIAVHAVWISALFIYDVIKHRLWAGLAFW